MSDPNVLSDAMEHDLGPVRGSQVGATAGARALGATVFELQPGAVVAFVPGPEGAHRLRNVGDEPCRYLMISTMIYPEVAEHVDTGSVLAMRGPADGRIFPGGTEGDHMQLIQAAIDADR